jgi:hypothetical protein
VTPIDEISPVGQQPAGAYMIKAGIGARLNAVARHYRVLLPTTANAFENQLASVASVR